MYAYGAPPMIPEERTNERGARLKGPPAMSGRFERDTVFVTLLATVTFILYAWLPLTLHSNTPKFTSPDETANYFFSRTYANRSTLAVQAPLTTEMSRYLAPRSVVVRSGRLVPESFLGLPLTYGTVAKVAGTDALPYLTGAIASLTLFPFFCIFRRVFSVNIARLALPILAFLPPYWYYASRGFMHNVLFLCVFVMVVAVFLKIVEESRTPGWNFRFAFVGALLGIALATRSAEIVWIGPLTLIAAFILRRRIGRINLGVFVGALIFTLVPILLLNNQLYGNPLSFAARPVGTATSGDGALETTVRTVSRAALPFGVDFLTLSSNASRYLVTIFPWFTAFVLLGVGSAVFDAWRRTVTGLNRQAFDERDAYLAVFLFMTLVLILYYGSAVIIEYLNPDQVILGSSFLRYWLPVYVFATPFFAIGVRAVYFRIRNLPAGQVVTVCIVVVAILASATKVLVDPLQGLGSVREAAQALQADAHVVIANTEPEAVIISGDMDKAFFPDRMVVARFGGTAEEFARLLRDLLAVAPVYSVADPSLDRSPFPFDLVPQFARQPVLELPSGKLLDRVGYK